MLIEQQHIATELFRLRRTYSPLPRERHSSYQRPWELYARHRKAGSWGVIRVDKTAEEIYTRRNGNFASRLASYTAGLEYEGNTLFAIMTLTYTGSDPDYRSATNTEAHNVHRAFTIRSIDDYMAAQDYFLPDQDDEMAWDLDWSYSINFVVAPTSIIEVDKS